MKKETEQKVSQAFDFAMSDQKLYKDMEFIFSYTCKGFTNYQNKTIEKIIYELGGWMGAAEKLFGRALDYWTPEEIARKMLTELFCYVAVDAALARYLGSVIHGNKTHWEITEANAYFSSTLMAAGISLDQLDDNGQTMKAPTGITSAAMIWLKFDVDASPTTDTTPMLDTTVSLTLACWLINKNQWTTIKCKDFGRTVLEDMLKKDNL